MAKAFNLIDLVALRQITRSCKPEGRNRFKPDEVTNLAIARTGSESLTKALRKIKQPSHHNHACTLASLAVHGARKVLVSIRHPVARIVSGYQRRLETDSQKAGNKRVNIEFVKAFRMGGLESFVRALRTPGDPNHQTALNVTYGNIFSRSCLN